MTCKVKDKKEYCFLCCMPIKKGHRKRIIHDNIYNDINPKIFCCNEHKMMYIFGHKLVSLMSFL